jgi:hypothetical protein
MRKGEEWRGGEMRGEEKKGKERSGNGEMRETWERKRGGDVSSNGPTALSGVLIKDAGIVWVGREPVRPEVSC